MLLGMPAPHIRAPGIPGSTSYSIPLLTCNLEVIAQVPTWETQNELWVPGFKLVHPWLL